MDRSFDRFIIIAASLTKSLKNTYISTWSFMFIFADTFVTKSADSLKMSKLRRLS